MRDHGGEVCSAGMTPWPLPWMKVAFPFRYRAKMNTTDPVSEKAKTPDPAATFGQSLGQSQRFCADNYLM